MRFSRIAFAGSLACICALASAGNYDGKWTVEWINNSGIQREATLVIAGDKGTYAAAGFRQRGAPDPCQSREHPVEVTSSTDEGLSVKVLASQTMAGCRDTTLNFRKVADGKLEGQFGSEGRKVTATRR